MKGLKIGLGLVLMLVFGGVGAFFGLTLTAASGTVRDTLAMKTLCAGAVQTQRRGFSGGVVGYGTSAKGSRVYEYTCTFADGRRETIGYDRAALTAFGVGTGLGMLGGWLGAGVLWTLMAVLLRKKPA